MLGNLSAFSFDKKQMMRFTWVLSLAFFTVIQMSESEKILGIFTVPSKSHSILAFELFKELVKSGHEVKCTHRTLC